MSFYCNKFWFLNVGLGNPNTINIPPKEGEGVETIVILLCVFFKEKFNRIVEPRSTFFHTRIHVSFTLRICYFLSYVNVIPVCLSILFSFISETWGITNRNSYLLCSVCCFRYSPKFILYLIQNSFLTMLYVDGLFMFLLSTRKL